MAIYRLGDRIPTLAPDCFVAQEATLIGRVAIGAEATVWPGAVLRGDIELIDIGARSSVQDGTVMHTDPGCPLTVGEGVTIGHQATLHGCTIGDGALIGMQAIVLNRAVIGRNSLVGAGALITEGKTFPENSLILGAPARWVRELTAEEIENLATTAERYVKRGRDYRENLVRLD
ncbi:putative lipopolysaccharide biosynthesis O-acetyl transferase WbbJ [Rosistilla carotiformis]|uniref:Putative lipopolysaccharide biosynthesis O-acetyl transferase WbbJ n=1 Tax=Rosistilla carotiformis TaxID=2528017 RepID=A0A518JRR4_9BACT|nr:gamma carbonic anhydrase family protein [Rosistilla carotiformis]QDV68249.1 putative lipopolysaccharide biosynthesis O-acetyl transferase WbbJ [Rosistilla carotiformis]